MSQLPPTIRMYNKMHANQCLSDKKHLFFNMRDMYRAEGKDPFSILPLTYVIDDGLNDLEWDNFELTFKAIEETIKPTIPIIVAATLEGALPIVVAQPVI